MISMQTILADNDDRKNPAIGVQTKKESVDDSSERSKVDTRRWSVEHNEPASMTVALASSHVPERSTKAMNREDPGDKFVSTH